MATTTLHIPSIPPWGMLQFSARRAGTNPASPVITNCYCSYPSQHIWTTLSILLQNPYKKSNHNYPQDISLQMPSLSGHDHNWPLQYSYRWNGTTIKKKIKNKLFLHAVRNDSIRYQLPSYHHNLVEMWLIMLPMTPRFSVSSKDGSNIKGCSASSSEDDCNTMFTRVLDLVPYGYVFWGGIESLVGFFTSRVGGMVLGTGSDGLSLPVSFKGHITAAGSPCT